MTSMRLVHTEEITGRVASGDRLLTATSVGPGSCRAREAVTVSSVGHMPVLLAVGA
jgi:hypothetical protein